MKKHLLLSALTIGLAGIAAGCCNCNSGSDGCDGVAVMEVMEVVPCSQGGKCNAPGHHHLRQKNAPAKPACPAGNNLSANSGNSGGILASCTGCGTTHNGSGNGENSGNASGDGAEK